MINFCEPVKFIGEQHRVLKPGGKMVILCVHNPNNQPEEWVPTEGCVEKELFDRVWAGASKNTNSDIKRFENRPEKYFELLEKQGFCNLSLDVISAVTYAPDCDNTSREMAFAQINEDRLSELCSVEKAFRMAPDALTEEEFKTLNAMINRRYDKVIDAYNRGEKTWNFRIGTTILISGIKSCMK